MERTGGIHKNLNKLISITGGYDYKYHAAKIAEQYNLKTEDVIKVMEISETTLHKTTKGLFNSYFNMLRNGIPIEGIVKMEEERSRRAFSRLMNIANATLPGDIGRSLYESQL